MTSSPIETFRCTPLSCSLTASSCGRRHLEAVPLSGSPGKSRPLSSVCRTCEVGASHARGDLPSTWPDGSPIVRLTTSSSSTLPPPEQPKKRAFVLTLDRNRPRPTKETTMPAKLMLTWNGRTQSLADWSREMGVSGPTIKKRHERGQPLDGSDASETPPTEPKRKSPTRRKPAASSSAPAEEPVEIDGPALLGIAGIRHEIAGRTPRGLLVLLLDPSAS